MCVIKHDALRKYSRNCWLSFDTKLTTEVAVTIVVCFLLLFLFEHVSWEHCVLSQSVYEMKSSILKCMDSLGLLDLLQVPITLFSCKTGLQISCLWVDTTYFFACKVLWYFFTHKCFLLFGGFFPCLFFESMELQLKAAWSASWTCFGGHWT